MLKYIKKINKGTADKNDDLNGIYEQGLRLIFACEWL